MPGEEVTDRRGGVIVLTSSLTAARHREGVLAALERAVEQRIPGGDHEIVVGRPRQVETSGQDAIPLLYWRGSSASLGEA
jgi:flavin reductase (DIM6/NTAB) family NADH-FMN oxidoreductase RutF